MPNVEKIIEKMRRQPNGISFNEAVRVLEHFGYRLDRQKGSHAQFINDVGDVYTVKKDTPLKACYVKGILSREPKE